MNKTRLLAVPVLLAFYSQPIHAHEKMAGMKARTNTTKLAFSSQPSAIPVGKAAMWTLKITDAKSGNPVNDFEVEMTKLMHLIVVKSDSSWFNHIHPTFKGNGTFVVTATLPTAGTYKLYADYTRKSQGQEVPQYQLAVGGQTKPTAARLVADKMQGMWLKKSVNSHPEGQPGAKSGATYQVALMPMPMPLMAGQDTMLHFQIRDAKGQPVTDLQPYLGAMGHCVILSSDTKSYLHSHPMEGGMKMDGDMSKMNHSAPPKSSGPNVMFHTNFPHAGLYKAWGQFQHKGQILTVPFVFAVKPNSSGDTMKTKTMAALAASAAMIGAAHAAPTKKAPSKPAPKTASQQVTILLPDGYKTGVATVQAGKPVALTFHLTKDAGCGNTVSVPAAKWTETLKVGEKATVTFTPKKSGALSFACGMGMYEGSVVVK